MKTKQCSLCPNKESDVTVADLKRILLAVSGNEVWTKHVSLPEGLKNVAVDLYLGVRVVTCEQDKMIRHQLYHLQEVGQLWIK